jgi:hypothetical protein
VTTNNDAAGFDDVEKVVAEAITRQLELVRELDAMEIDVTAWEADFLQTVLNQLNDLRRPLTQTQLEILHRMCNQYEIDYGDFFDGKK